MVNCTRCGEKLPQSAHFCPVCGLDVTPEEQETTTAPQMEEASAYDEALVEQSYEEANQGQVTDDEIQEEPRFNPKYVHNIAMFCHIAAFAGLSAPLGNILGPFVLWRLKRRDDPFIDYNGKQAINFQISMSIGALIVVLIGFPIPVLGWALAFPIIALWVFGVVRASIKANRGIEYRYPLSYSFLK